MFFKGCPKRFASFFPTPKDVYGAVKPLHVVCQIIGLGPYKTKVLNNGTKEYHRSLWTLSRCVVLCFFYACNVVMQIVTLDEPMGKSMGENLPKFQEYFIALIGLVSVSFACIYGQKIVEAFKNIGEIDRAFQGIAVWMPYRRVFIIATINVLLIFLSGLVMIITIFAMYPTAMLTPMDLWEISIYLLLLLFTYLMESQYVHYLNLLRYRYALLNENLEVLAKENKQSNCWTSSDQNSDEEESNKISKHILKTVEMISNPILVIEKVANLHIKLSDTATLINAAFSVQLLFRITIAFINIVTALYTIGVNFSNPDNDADSINVDISFTLWAVSSAFELMAIVWVTNSTCEEANKCPRLMHKIRNATKNAKLQDMIEMYSLQMYHNRLQFFVCGLFPLDYTLLHTIVAGVTTYLVILIQFNTAGSGPSTISDVVYANATVDTLDVHT